MNNTFVVVLAHGQAEKLSYQTIQRIEEGAKRDAILRGTGKPAAGIVFAAGVGGSPQGTPTLASAMKRYAEQYLRRYPQGTTRIYCNMNDERVWGTEGEIRWVKNHPAFPQGSKFELVTNHRHGVRALAFARLVGLDARLVVSRDQPPPLYHEVLGWGRYLLCRLGLDSLKNRIVEWRRLHYTKN